MRIEKFNVPKGWSLLVSAGTVQVVSRDDYVVVVECSGLAFRFCGDIVWKKDLPTYQRKL